MPRRIDRIPAIEVPMKIAVRSRKSLRNVRAATQPASQDHDLPVLALEEARVPGVDWDELLRDGVQPALLVDGERRSRGRR
jgi:hypothetical protein